MRLVGSLYRCCSSRYGSNRGHDSLVCFSIARDGLLKLVGFTYTGGRKHLCNCDLSMPLQSFTAVSTFSFSFRHPWIAAALLALHRGAPSELQHSSIWKLDLGGQPGDLIVSLIPLCLLYIYIYSALSSACICELKRNKHKGSQAKVWIDRYFRRGSEGLPTS